MENDADQGLLIVLRMRRCIIAVTVFGPASKLNCVSNTSTEYGALQ